MISLHRSLARVAFGAAATFCLAAPPQVQAQSEFHGGIYDLARQLNRAAAVRSLERVEGLAPAAAADVPADPITSFFVNIYDPAGSTPLTAAQNAALALSMGRAANERGNPSNPEIPAGFTFLGQFIDHDVTRNEMKVVPRVLQLELQLASTDLGAYYAVVSEVLQNARSSLVDLDSVYGLSREQIKRLADILDGSPFCAPVGEPAAGCFDATTLSAEDQRALATMELDGANQLTGRFEVAFRASGLGGPIFPDLPRCGDNPRNFLTPACIPNVEDGEGAADIAHRAVIGDGRNDENIVIAQIHLMFLMAHNKLFDAEIAQFGENPTPGQRLEAFEAARRTLIDHWQAVILDDYLTEHLDRETVDAIREGNFSFYTTGDGAPYCEAQPGAMPHEFAVGAFRHGHSQVRGGYLLNTSGGENNGASFRSMFGDKMIFVERVVDFRHFFNGVRQFDATANASVSPTPTQALDTILSPPLAELMAPSIPKPDIGDPVAGQLAARNLSRAGGEAVTRASDGEVTIEPIPLLKGLEVAMAMQKAGIAVTPLTDEEVAALNWEELPDTLNATEEQIAFLEGITAADLSLWAYVLAEAEIQHGGRRLGDVGGVIIAETLTGLIACDKAGILARDDFEPTLAPTGGLVEEGRVHMADIINFALFE